MKMATAHEILIAAKALIPDEAHWWHGQGDFRRGCECALTALIRAAGPRLRLLEKRPAARLLEAERALAAACGVEDAEASQTDDVWSGIARWNDAPERTLAEVHAAFDWAIEATKP